MLFVFLLSLLELSSTFVELHLAYLQASRMLRALRTPLIGKTSATVHSDAARKSHEDGEGTEDRKRWVEGWNIVVVAQA